MSLGRLREYLEIRKGDGAVFREIHCPSDPQGLQEGLPFRMDQDTHANIILKEDTFVELGPPNRSSCNFVLVSSSPGLLTDGRITLVGPDIRESAGKALPFGQVLMVAGEQLAEEHRLDLEQCQYISNRLPGYMIRFLPGRIWSRVGISAAAKGFSFETLGRSLMALYKSSQPMVEAMEIVFVTSSDSDVGAVRDLLKGAARKGMQIIKEKYKCDSGLDCDQCPYQPICEEIQRMTESLKGRPARGPLQSASFKYEGGAGPRNRE